MAQFVERERKANKDKPRQLQAEARELQTKLDRFMRAIADGEEPKTILGEIKRLETRLGEIQGEQQALSESLPFGPRHRFETSAVSDCAASRNCCLGMYL
jgi:hypothetical protein